MTLLTAGYFPTTYFAENYFNPLYWPAYGTEENKPSPPSTTIVTPSGAIKTSPRFPLTLGLTLEGELIWVFPIPIKKENKPS